MNGLLIAWVNLNCQFLHSTGQSKYQLNERQSCRKSNRFTLLVKITLGWQVQIILKVDPPLLRSVSLFTAFCDWYFKDPLMISRGSETGKKTCQSGLCILYILETWHLIKWASWETTIKATEMVQKRESSAQLHQVIPDQQIFHCSSIAKSLLYISELNCWYCVCTHSLERNPILRSNPQPEQSKRALLLYAAKPNWGGWGDFTALPVLPEGSVRGENRLECSWGQ